MDTLLHLYHIQFNEILKRIVEEEFYDQIIYMSQAMMDGAEPISNRLTDEQWKQMLESGQAPPRPTWITSFYQP